MYKFFKELMSTSSDTSSKRFAALFTLLNVLILAYLAAWKSGWVCPPTMFDSLCMIVGGGLGLTVLEKVFNKKKDNPDATDCDTTTTGSTENP